MRLTARQQAAHYFKRKRHRFIVGVKMNGSLALHSLEKKPEQASPVMKPVPLKK